MKLMSGWSHREKLLLQEAWLRKNLQLTSPGPVGMRHTELTYSPFKGRMNLRFIHIYIRQHISVNVRYFCPLLSLTKVANRTEKQMIHETKEIILPPWKLLSLQTSCYLIEGVIKIEYGAFSWQNYYKVLWELCFGIRAWYFYSISFGNPSMKWFILHWY